MICDPTNGSVAPGRQPADYKTSRRPQGNRAFTTSRVYPKSSLI
jgi:hypothetical protein